MCGRLILVWSCCVALPWAGAKGKSELSVKDYSTGLERLIIESCLGGTDWLSFIKLWEKYVVVPGRRKIALFSSAWLFLTYMAAFNGL